jgi:N-acetylmuramoyl-L-alanine amidase
LQLHGTSISNPAEATLWTTARYYILFLLFFLIFPLVVTAQNTLPRVSIAERSDGLGFVIRYHFTSAPDSFKIFQPSADLIQVAVYKKGVQLSAVNLPAAGSTIRGFNVTEIPGGFGTDIRLSGNRVFLANAYPDANQRHLLVGLTEISRRELDILTADQPVIDWFTVHRAPVVALPTDPQRTTQPDPSLVELVQPDTIPQLTDRAGRTDSATAPIPVVNSRVSQQSRLRTIILDAGHGGHDPGSIGLGKTREKDVTLSVVKKIGAYLNEHMPEINVVYTRTTDAFVPLEERGSIANRARGDLFISVHTNAARNRQAYGAEVFFLGIARTESALEVMKRENSVILLEDPGSRSSELSEEELILYELNNIGYMSASQRLAELVDRQFSDRAGRRSRGVKQAGFIVLYHASMPAILVELGFVSNPTEEKYLMSDSGQNVLASAIFRAIREYKELIEH